jgi:hypothetical protein
MEVTLFGQGQYRLCAKDIAALKRGEQSQQVDTYCTTCRYEAVRLDIT